MIFCTVGHLWHLDFGWMFGRDPKPYPPPFKLTKEMVEGMGGMGSATFGRFKQYCCQCYNLLRKSANLILNLIHLMVLIPSLLFLCATRILIHPPQYLFRKSCRSIIDRSFHQRLKYYAGPKSKYGCVSFPKPYRCYWSITSCGVAICNLSNCFAMAFRTWHKVVLQKVQENFRLDLTDEGNARLIDLHLFFVRLKCIVHSHMWTTHTWQMRSTILFTSSTKGGSPRY